MSFVRWPILALADLSLRTVLVLVCERTDTGEQNVGLGQQDASRANGMFPELAEVLGARDSTVYGGPG